MNFFFMMTLILIILIFIKLKIKVIHNYIFLFLLLLLLLINEIYYYKPNRESFNPYTYDGSYNKYFKTKDYLHLNDNYLNNLGKLCKINKNIGIKKIQNSKFDYYNDLLSKMDNVVYGSANPDELKIPDNFNNINEEKEKIEKINDIICPPTCHLIEDEYDCNNAVDYKEILENEDKILTTQPIFNNKTMLRHAYECLKSDPCDTSLGCRQEGDMCIYDKKKCEYDKEKKVCRQLCEISKTKQSCPKEYCHWNIDNLKCENKF